MADETTPRDSSAEELVPTETIPCGTLPALKWRDLPEPI